MGERICSSSDCQRPARARGMCQAHYCRARKRGDFVPTPRKSPKMAGPGQRACSESDCGRKYFSRGLCNAHYTKAYRRGELAMPAQIEIRFDRHSLQNIDPERKVADCIICGVGVRVRIRADHHPQCWTVEQRRRRRQKRTTRQVVSREQRLKLRYKLRPGEYEALLAAQGGTCAICLQPPPYKLFVDHCHETGRVRGLLCAPCNSGLGMLRDRPERAARAAIYLAQK